ncbi:AsmA family protein [Parasedimentitalea psychrophila]|uniref:AsmA family protein n=1 Tax=Parasedimentitalea psychrophila TaxID=2997337 RepID=A0A9Y2KX68_9RHOB|nr:AsmA family protein [Parasedimentitalea psychrophila]WIY23502.1 AsmA family protein [Parasedimentitalea psychrophila]
MRLLFRVFVALVITVVVVIGGLLLLPGDKLAELVSDQLEAQTGRKLAVSGEVGLSVWPVLGVKAHGVSLSNADWAADQPMLTAESLSIGISAPDLLNGDVRIKSITAKAPHLNLSTDASGQGNWVLTPAIDAAQSLGAEAEGAAEGVGAALSVEALVLSGASVSYAAHGEALVELRNIDLQLKWPEPNGTVDFLVTLHQSEAPVQIKGEIGTFAAFLDGQVASVGATVTMAKDVARFDGRGGINGEASGRLTVKSENIAAALRAAGLAGISLPRGLGQRITAGSDLTYTPDGRLTLRDLTLDLGGNLLTGAVDLTLGAVPHFTAKLEAQDLDFSALTATSGAYAAASPAGSGWSQDRIDASGLTLANGSLELSVASLDTGGVKLGASKLTLSIDNARAVLSFLPLSVFGGTVQGQLVANNRNGLSVGGKLTYAGIRLEQALGQLAGYDRLHGEALGEVQFLGIGNTQDAIMRSLSGKGWLEIGKGFLTGFDLEGLMRSGGGNGGSTVFDGLTASYTLKDGNLDNQDLLISLKAVRADGKGRIGLGAQDLDYLFTPTATAANGGQGLSIPLRITGPWSDPKIRPDLSMVLEAEIDGIEDQATEQLLQKLSEELEVEMAPEQDLGEAIQDGLEQRAKDSLLRLLQGN